MKVSIILIYRALYFLSLFLSLFSLSIYLSLFLSISLSHHDFTLSYVNYYLGERYETQKIKILIKKKKKTRSADLDATCHACATLHHRRFIGVCSRLHGEYIHDRVIILSTRISEVFPSLSYSGLAPPTPRSLGAWVEGEGSVKPSAEDCNTRVFTTRASVSRKGRPCALLAYTRAKVTWLVHFVAVSSDEHYIRRSWNFRSPWSVESHFRNLRVCPTGWPDWSTDRSIDRSTDRPIDLSPWSKSRIYVQFTGVRGAGWMCVCDNSRLLSGIKSPTDINRALTFIAIEVVTREKWSDALQGTGYNIFRRAFASPAERDNGWHGGMYFEDSRITVKVTSFLRVFRSWFTALQIERVSVVFNQ